MAKSIKDNETYEVRILHPVKIGPSWLRPAHGKAKVMGVHIKENPEAFEVL